MCSRTKDGVGGVLEVDLIPTLVDRLLAESELILKIPILDTLHWCLMADPLPGLKCKAIERMQSHLSHEKGDIKWRACRCMYDLTLPHPGKITSVECKLVSDLVPLVRDGNPLVRVHSIATLMSIAVITDGKYAILETNILSSLVELLTESTSEVRLNAVKTLTLLAETPKGKELLKSNLDKVKLLEGDVHPVVSKAAKTAYNVITWTP
jgi:hypothetical protein